MKITSLSVRTFLGIKFYKAETLGKLNQITGGNGAGKSSLLKAITEAFNSQGKDPNLITVGAEKAEIMIELDSGVTVSRTITPKDNKLKVVQAGEEINKPVAYLKNLLGESFFNFRPVDFFLADARTRRSLLLKALPAKITHDDVENFLRGRDLHSEELSGKLVGYDYDTHALVVSRKIIEDVYNWRHEIGIEVTRLQKAIEQERTELEPLGDIDRWKTFDFQSAVASVKRGNEVIAEQDRKRAELERLRSKAVALQEYISDLRDKLEEAQKELNQVTTDGQALKVEISNFVTPDMAQVNQDILDYDKFRKLQFKMEAIDKRVADFEVAQENYENYDKIHDALVNDFPKVILEKMRIQALLPGLKIEGDAISVNDVDLEKLSTSEQMRLAVRLARHLSGNLKVICVDGIEALDTEARKAFEEESKDDDFEYFIARVTDGPLNLSSEGAAASPALKKNAAPEEKPGAKPKTRKKSEPGF